MAKAPNKKLPENPAPRGRGRPKGALNKATAELKAIAREYTEQAVETLAQIMQTSESDAARVAAVNALLDRGWGKPSQVIAGDADNPVTVIQRIELVGVRPK